MMLAITREISPSFQACQLTHLERQPIDLELARQQHAAYQTTLRELGCKVLALPPEPNLPDAVFVEDVALVLDEIAIITRPGAPSRRAETTSIGRALAPYRPLIYLEDPATLDGGDVLRLGRTLFVGTSKRTNAAGIEQLARLVAPFQYGVRTVSLGACLHLKTAVCQVAPATLLLNPEWVDPRQFEMADSLAVASEEPMAANALLVESTVIYAAAFPETRKVLERAGIALRVLDVSELAKAEAGVTCCSLIFAAPVAT